MKFRELVEVDLEYLKKIVALEEEAFEGQGGVDLWILKALIRYGKVFVLETAVILNENVICVTILWVFHD